MTPCLDAAPPGAPRGNKTSTHTPGKKVWGKKAKQTRGTVGGDKLQPLRNETNKTSLVFRISLLLMTNINLLRVADLHSCGGNLITYIYDITQLV